MVPSPTTSASIYLPGRPCQVSGSHLRDSGKESDPDLMSSVIIKYLCLPTPPTPTCNEDVDIITSREITNVRLLWSHNVFTADSYPRSGCLVVDGGAWWLLTGLLIGHLVYVLLSSVTPIPSCCAVVHHFRMSCDKAALTHFCQLNVSRVNWTWLRLELTKHFNFTPNNKASQEHH